MKKHTAPPSILGPIILPCDAPRVARPIKTPPCPKNMPAAFWRKVCNSIQAMIKARSFRDVIFNFTLRIGANINRITGDIIEVVIDQYHRTASHLMSQTHRFRFVVSEGIIQPA
ncbi:MAG: hypothetical protein KBC33_00325 [Candidatus Pacebacteria bacterium]|nr:hypothetical protein [Candidatus Paceibacterota bacterium]